MPVAPGVALFVASSALSANLTAPFATGQILTLTMIGYLIRRVGKLLVAWQNWCARCPKIPDQAEDWPMWEKCVGCGEGLFAGDAFCGNCGRPVTPAVPAAREPDGLESAHLAVPTAMPAADLVQVRIIPAGHDLAAPGPASPEQTDSASADPEQADPEQAQPHESKRQRQTLAAAAKSGPGVAASVRPAATRLSGSANLDPIRNARYLACVLRQAGLFTGVYLLIETVLWLYLLVSREDGTTLGSALRPDMDSVRLVALLVAILFLLIPVPALLSEWSLLMEQSSDAAQLAFEQISSAFGTHGVPLDSQRVRTVSRHGEDDREYLELRRGHFRGYISCFVHGTDLYVGWTFWLYMSPLRLLMMVISRNIKDAISQRKGIQRSLRFESARALMAAIHGATLAGIDAASEQLDSASPQLVRETAIDMNFRLG
jgi:hypothetical protein